MANLKIIQTKKNEVKSLSKKFNEAKVVLIADYRGITVSEVTALREELRKVNAEYMVIKNNIVRRALKEIGIETIDEALVGPTAVIIGNEDYLAPLKVIYNFMKAHDFYKIKAGIISGEVKTTEEVITLAKLPSREELLSKLAGVLLANISKFAVAINEVKKVKEAGSETKEEKVEENA